VRLLVIGGGKPECCWRCGCIKSGWANVPNEVSSHCFDDQCICHTVERAE
jgi:hypothetical protein